MKLSANSIKVMQALPGTVLEIARATSIPITSVQGTLYFLRKEEMVESDEAEIGDSTWSKLEGKLQICPPNCKVNHDAKQFSTKRRYLDTVEGLPPAPTTKDLEKHAKKFGPESVQEEADRSGNKVDLTGYESKKRIKPRRESRKVSAKKMLDEGTSWTIIEDVLDLPLSVSKRLKKELGA